MLKYFPFNMHFAERLIRIALGLVMTTYVAWGPLTPLATIIHPLWGLLGLYPLTTGFWGSEPIYTLLGLNFRKKKLVLVEWDLQKQPWNQRAADKLDSLDLNAAPPTPRPSA